MLEESPDKSFTSAKLKPGTFVSMILKRNCNRSDTDRNQKIRSFHTKKLICQSSANLFVLDVGATTQYFICWFVFTFYSTVNFVFGAGCKNQWQVTTVLFHSSEIKDHKKHLSCSLTCPGENNSSFSVECKVKLIDRLLLKKGKIMKWIDLHT